jgi:hypothetical protein
VSGADVALIITASTGTVTAIGVLVKVLIELRRVHTVVNSRFDAMLRYQLVLIKKLGAEGVEIPEDESLKAK